MTTYHIPSTNKLKGSVFLPASKSYSIRAFVVAALGGRSRIIHPSDCDDSLVASRVAQALGASVKKAPDNTWEVVADQSKPLPKSINVKESGTALRLLLPLASLRQSPTVINGSGTLRGRPNRFLVETIQRMGVDIDGAGAEDSIPIRIRSGAMVPGRITIDGSISSQFISALLMTLPQLDRPSELILKGKLVSQDYIEMTREVLTLAGIKLDSVSARKFRIPGGQRFRGLKRFTVPSDDGLAAFLMAAAVLTDSDIKLTGHLGTGLIQADGHIYRILERMGVPFQKTRSSIKIKGPIELRGGRFSLKHCPDLLPILSVLALFADRPTTFTDIGHARVKESDRITDLRKELEKVGADITESSDKMVIRPQSVYKTDRLLNPHRDHRLAMAFCVLGLKVGVRLRDIHCINKSYPGFIKDFKSIGAKVLPK